MRPKQRHQIGRPTTRKDRASLVAKRSISIGDHHSSVSLEEAFWSALREIAVVQNMSVPELVSRIDEDRQNKNRSSTIRVFVLDY
jgi:predicted DNA-binding ribbon-helix-helix protein